MWHKGAGGWWLHSSLTIQLLVDDRTIHHSQLSIGHLIFTWVSEQTIQSMVFEHRVWHSMDTILVYIGDGHLNDSRCMIADWQSNRSYWNLRNWTVKSTQIRHTNSHNLKYFANEQYYFNSRGNGTETEIIFFDYGMWMGALICTLSEFVPNQN